MLGKRIKLLREEKELSQLELAKILNINNSTLSQYEAGNRVPNDEIKKNIADYFNVSLDYLMGVSNIRNPYVNLPDKLESTKDAINFLIEDNKFMGFGGFNINTMSEEEILQFANELLEHLKFLSYKYKNKE